MNQAFDTAVTPEIPVTPARANAASKWLRIVSWVVQVPTAAMFVMAGAAKVRGAPEMVGLFQAIGIGQWFRYLTGGLELLGALLLVIPGLAGVGGALLVPVMLGAVATHLFIIGGSPLMAVVLLVASAFVAWARRDQLGAAVRKLRA